MSCECTSPGKKHAQPPSRRRTLFPVDSLYRFDQKKSDTAYLLSPSSADSFPGPFAVRRLGRRCAAAGHVANRATDSWPRRGAEPSAAARPARRRERSKQVPVGAAFSAPFLAGQKGGIPTDPTGRTATQRRALIWSVCRTIEEAISLHIDSRPNAKVRDPVPERPPAMANAIGHTDDRAGAFARDDARSAFRRGVSRACPQPATEIELRVHESGKETHPTSVARKNSFPYRLSF
jgi:hypothetical protein